MNITADEFKSCFPGAKDPQGWADALNLILPKYYIDSSLRVCHFLAQCGHESNGFTALKENLNYSAEALTATWPKRFPPEIAKDYARQPERIANRAYADRMGNGPESSGDGWKHRGMGVIQLTGKDNQSCFAKSCGKTLDEVVEYLQTEEGAVASACWFWANNGLNPLADKNDILAITKRINGGTNGLEDRKTRFNRVWGIIA